MLHVAMFDEVDGGAAMYKIYPKRSMAPSRVTGWHWMRMVTMAYQAIGIFDWQVWQRRRSTGRYCCRN